VPFISTQKGYNNIRHFIFLGGINLKEKLMVVWISRDVEKAINMGFMYAKNSKLLGWWEEVEIVIWGPSAKIAAENKTIQKELKEMKEAGVNIKACLACAKNYGVVEKLKDLDIEVIYMGQPLTEELKKGTSVITI
jgi:hypothetical protein